MQKVLHKLANMKLVKELLTKNRFLMKFYFDYLYLKDNPYQTQSDKAEKKFQHAFRLLGKRWFKRGLEIGCGEGGHTWRLATICDSVDALDISSNAIHRAKRNCDRLNINFFAFDVVKDLLKGQYDFIFCSEVLYYLHLDQLDSVIGKIVAVIEPGGVVELVHCRSVKDDTSGLELKEFGAKTIHERFLNHQSLHVMCDEETPRYRITLLQHTAPNINV